MSQNWRLRFHNLQYKNLMCCLLTPKFLDYPKRCWLQEYHTFRLNNPMFWLEKFDQQMKRTALWCLKNWIQSCLVFKEQNFFVFPGRKLDIFSLSLIKEVLLLNTRVICFSLRSYFLRRPQHFAKSSPYFWLAKVRWRFCKILWPSQNI